MLLLAQNPGPVSDKVGVLVVPLATDSIIPWFSAQTAPLRRDGFDGCNEMDKTRGHAMTTTTNLLKDPGYRYPDIPDMREPWWSRIFGSSQKKHVPAGTCIYKEEERCHYFMWLLEGTVRVFKHSPGGREITLYRVTPGELCVLSLRCLIGGEGFPAVAMAETDVLGLTLDKQEFDEAIDRSREFRRYLLQMLSRRLSDVVQLVSDVTFHRLELRLSCLLGQLFRLSAGEPLRITHSRLAHELGTTREMVSRILKELERKQCIQLARGEIRLLSQDVFGWYINP